MTQWLEVMLQIRSLVLTDLSAASDNDLLMLPLQPIGNDLVALQKQQPTYVAVSTERNTSKKAN